MMRIFHLLPMTSQNNSTGHLGGIFDSGIFPLLVIFWQ